MSIGGSLDVLLLDLEQRVREAEEDLVAFDQEHEQHVDGHGQRQEGGHEGAEGDVDELVEVKVYLVQVQKY